MAVYTDEQKRSFGPKLAISEEVHADKYRAPNESFYQAMTRVADALKDDLHHFNEFRDILLNMRFMPAGRIQSSMGSPRKTTPYNCFVSETLEDSMDGIMRAATRAAETMRLGGGIGYDFSTLRPRGDLIKSLESRSSGPISFMGIFDAVCKTISSAGHRRGAQMGVLRVDHPDIEEFVHAKTNTDNLTGFNISIAITDEFMEAVKSGSSFDLKFDGRVYKTIDARSLWNDIARANWDWAEPGILFIDRINNKNNLWYTETIAATNPCAEQPLPPNGACLLGSFNLVKYVKETPDGGNVFDFEAFKHDIPVVVRAIDNVVDRAIYPLEEQKHEAQSKRRMGLGVTGLANAIEALGFPYGSHGFKLTMIKIMETLRNTAYTTSVSLAIEKGPFPLLDRHEFLQSDFAKTLPDLIRKDILQYGIRNSHLLSIAPTGTISLCADNISSGIEPVFTHSYTRTILEFDGPKEVEIKDYAYDKWGIKGKTALELSVFDHVDILNIASQYVDSACSKTCNVGDEVTFEEFKDVYMRAYEGGASGCTTFRAKGKRMGILNETPKEEEQDEQELEAEVIDLFSHAQATGTGDATACYFDPTTGRKTCE